MKIFKKFSQEFKDEVVNWVDANTHCYDFHHPFRIKGVKKGVFIAAKEKFAQPCGGPSASSISRWFYRCHTVTYYTIKT